MTISFFLFIHIIGGAVGLLAGGATAAFRKGSQKHIVAGRAFMIGMFTMALSGVIVAFIRSTPLSLANGILVLYLITTGWQAMRRPAGEVAAFDWAAMVVAFILSGSLMSMGVKAAASSEGLYGGFPAGVFYFFASVTAIGAMLDVRMLFRGGVRGTERVLRHLWRLFFALFMAAAAFFLGQSKVLPELLQHPVILFSPVILIVFTMIYWVLKMLFGRSYQNAFDN